MLGVASVDIGSDVRKRRVLLSSSHGQGQSMSGKDFHAVFPSRPSV